MRTSVAICGVCALVLGASSAAVNSPPPVPETYLIKDEWIISRNFLFKRDKAKDGKGPVKVRQNHMAKLPSGEVGFWKLEQKKAGQGIRAPVKNFFVIEVPQDREQTIIVSYEVPVTQGRYHKAAVRFDGPGEIFISNTKAVGTPGGPPPRKKIGGFRVEVETLPPLVDHAFR